MEEKEWWMYELDDKGNKVCAHCKKIFEPSEKRIPHADWEDYFAICEPCAKKQHEIDIEEDWQYHTNLIKLIEIHCIKCCSLLPKESITSTYTSESEVSFKCPKCQFEFTIWHGEPSYEDPHELDDYDEEKERERYYINKYGEY